MFSSVDERQLHLDGFLVRSINPQQLPIRFPFRSLSPRIKRKLQPDLNSLDDRFMSSHGKNVNFKEFALKEDGLEFSGQYNHSSHSAHSIPKINSNTVQNYLKGSPDKPKLKPSESEEGRKAKK